MYFFPLDIPPFFKAAPIPLVAIPPPFCLEGFFKRSKAFFICPFTFELNKGPALVLFDNVPSCFRDKDPINFSPEAAGNIHNYPIPFFKYSEALPVPSAIVI
jgi:hypothetical protein